MRRSSRTSRGRRPVASRGRRRGIATGRAAYQYGVRRDRKRSASMGRVTLKTIADRVGVSRMTVSNAFSRPDQLSAKLRDRILAVAELLGDGQDPIAQARRQLVRAGERVGNRHAAYADAVG